MVETTSVPRIYQAQQSVPLRHPMARERNAQPPTGPTWSLHRRPQSDDRRRPNCPPTQATMSQGHSMCSVYNRLYPDRTIPSPHPRNHPIHEGLLRGFPQPQRRIPALSSHEDRPNYGKAGIQSPACGASKTAGVG